MSMFRFGRDDVDFEGYLEEIRKFREEMDREGEHGSDTGESPVGSDPPILDLPGRALRPAR